MEARPLALLVDAVLPRAWRRDSPLHGDEHWRCVIATGLALASATQEADPELVFCFGLLHDTRRENESIDPGHGPRAVKFAHELRAEGALALEGTRFGLLIEALELHSNGLTSLDPTVGTCWDADRLHLPRVSIQPNPALLSTRAAAGAAPLDAAAQLRSTGPPSWDNLAAAVPTHSET